MKLSKKSVLQILVFILLLAGVGAGVYLVQQSQMFKSKAATTFSLAGFKRAYDSCDPNKVVPDGKQACIDTQSYKRYESQYDIDSDGWINLKDYFQLLPQFKDKAPEPTP